MNRIRRNRGPEGFVVVIALIAIMAITFFILTSVSTTTSTMKVSGNYARTVGIFNIAEAGLAKARPLLENQSFSSLLTTYSGGYLISPTSFNGGTYEVTITDDSKDTDGSPLTDNNSIIKVISTARNSQGGRVQIETHLQLIQNNISFPPNPTGCGAASCDSAALLCGTTSDVSTQGAAAIDGTDYPLPAFGCNGSGCNTTGNGATTTNKDILGEGGVTATGGITFTQNLGANSGCTQWQTFYNQWAAVSSSAPGVVTINSASYSGNNSCTTPKIYLVNTNGPLSITGNSYLCGMFILGTNASINLNGTVTLAGVILAMGNNSNLAYTGTSGTSNFFGKLIFRTTTVDAQKELAVKGNASILFSSQGMSKALEAINNANAGGGAGGTGTLLTAAWKENY